MPRYLLVVAFLSLGAAALLTACGGDNSGGSATVTSTLQPTAVPTVPQDTPTPSPDIHQDDLTQRTGLQDFLTASGGVVVPNSTLYADVTKDGVDDAIVPVSSGGEGGNIALFVYSYQPSGLVELLRVQPEIRLQAVVNSGSLIVTEPVYGPGDPFGFPSKLKVTTYEWNGTGLAVANEETKPSDQGPKP